MPRSSSYVITLTPKERNVVRAKIALLAAEGLEEIGERLDMPRPVVRKWRKRCYCERLAGLEHRCRRGRSSAFSPSGGRRGEGAGV